MALVDENTIGVVGILGSTYTGEYEPIAALDAALTALCEAQRRRAPTTGWDVPIHVDAASGGFVAPFLHPDLLWDFRLPRVRSINVSGHKYGLVYPGVGWVIWRESEDLPRELIFEVDYLGGSHANFGLNFSRGASQIVGAVLQLHPAGPPRATTTSWGRWPRRRAGLAAELADHRRASTIVAGGTDLPGRLRAARRRPALRRLRPVRTACASRLGRAGLPHGGRRPGRGRPAHRRARGPLPGYGQCLVDDIAEAVSYLRPSRPDAVPATVHPARGNRLIRPQPARRSPLSPSDP